MYMLPKCKYKIHVRPQNVLGWREWLSLPGLGIPAIKAKVDTGAKTSALHTCGIEPFQNEGKTWVRFQVHPWRKRSNLVITCAVPVLDQRVVRDSGGHSELRYVIETQLRLSELEWPVELTLTTRDTMLFPMLLGRAAIHDKFLVDPTASYLISTRPLLSKIYLEPGV